jgi:two-component system, chemotaxis family, sensor kinase CheA
VQTERGVGTTFKVKIPLTLAIIPALVVTSDGERYAIPQLSLLELVRLEGEQARRGIELISGTPVHRLRGRLLPIVGLRDELGQSLVEDTSGREVINIVVLQADGQQFGLVVDEINDTQEIVVKPLGSHLKDTTIFAGATIMGDGRVSLILDVLGLAAQSGLSRDLSELERELNASESTSASTVSTVHRRLLVVRIGERRFALSLDTVARLEEFKADAIETANHRPAVQYGSEIMPLVSLADELGVAGDHHTDVLPAIVFSEHDHNVGVLIDEIVDIVEADLQLDETDASRGVLGSFVIEGRVTDLVDVRAVLQAALPHVFRKVVAA